MNDVFDALAAGALRPMVRNLRAENAALEDRIASLEGAAVSECSECEQLRADIARLRDENSGLHERIADGDKHEARRLEKMEEARDFWRQRYNDLKESISVELDEKDADDQARFRDWIENQKSELERLRNLEIEVAMLRRAKGSGKGRGGRMAEWTPVQADDVRKAHAAGQSLREIAKAVGVTVAQVRTILDRPADRPHPNAERELKAAQRIKDQDEWLRRRVQELDHAIRGAGVRVARDKCKAALLARAVKER